MSKALKVPDVPIIVPNLATPTQTTFTEILDYNRKYLGVIKMFYDFPAQKSHRLLIFWIDGLIYHPNNKSSIIAPDGEYFLKLRALKLFGDVNNENDYEVWVSPKFKIKRIVN